MERLKAIYRRWVQTESEGQPSERDHDLLACMQGHRPISWLLPYRSYLVSDGIFINEDSVGFTLMAQPATALNLEDFKTLEGLFSGTYEVGSALQITLWAQPYCQEILERWKQARGQDSGSTSPDFFRFLAGLRCRYLAGADWHSLFRDETILLRDFSLLVSFITPRSKASSSTLTPHELANLQMHRDAIQSVLRSVHMSSHVVDDQGLARLIRNWFAPHSNLEEAPEPAELSPDIPLSVQMIHDECNLHVRHDHLQMQWREKKVSWLSLSVKKFSEHWMGMANGELIGGFFQMHQSIPCPFAIVMNAVMTDPLQSQTLAHTRLLRATQMRDTEVGKYVPAWKERQADWQHVSEQLAEGSKLVRVSYQVVAWSPQERKTQTLQAIQSVFDRLGWTLVQDRYCLPYRLLSALPMALGRELQHVLGRLRFLNLMTSWNCAHVTPWIAEWKGNVGPKHDPMLLLVGRRGQYLFLDPYLNNKGNFNIAVAAASGAGKSFFTQDYVCSLLGSGGRVFIIDSGGSYQNLCALLEGSYITFEQPVCISLNPFSHLHGLSSQEVAQHMPMLKSLLATMASPQELLSSKALALLEQAIMTAWHAHREQLSLEHVCDFLQGSTQELAKDLAVMLGPYTRHGMYGEYFSGQGNINFNNRLIVMELDALNAQPDLQNVVLLLLMQRITEAMYRSDRQQRKLCIIDEAWRLLGRGHSGQFIEEGYRTARKYGGAFMTITQGLPDYFQNSTTSACYANSDYVFMLRQKNESLAQAKAAGQLVISDWEDRVLRSLTTVGGRYSEVAIRSPEGLAVGRLIVDPWTEKLMSTRAEDVAALKLSQKRGLTRVQAITCLAGLRHE